MHIYINFKRLLYVDRFLLECPDGTVFILMCFTVRIFNGIGCSMAVVSSDAILMVTFPHHTAIIYVRGMSLRDYNTSL